MASSGERRLLFDTRGKRKHVIRVVYAILALLMGASLFLVVGPFNLGNILGNSGSSSSAAKVLHEQAERIERRLTKNPGDEQLLLTLTRAQINAGNAQIEQTYESEVPTITVGAKEDFQAAEESWSRYLKQAGDEPSPIGAQLVAATYFRLAEGSGSFGEIEENVVKAAAAQRIAADQRPNLNSRSTLAIYEYFAGDFAAGDKAAKQAAAEASSPAEAKGIEKQLAEYRKRGKAFEKQRKEAAKLEAKSGREALQKTPNFGIGGSSLGE